MQKRHQANSHDQNERTNIPVQKPIDGYNIAYNRDNNYNTACFADTEDGKTAGNIFSRP